MKNMRGKVVLSVIAMAVLVGYFIGKRFFPSENFSTFELVILAGLIIIFLGTLIAAIIQLLFALFSKVKEERLSKFGGWAISLVIFAVLIAGFLLASQMNASTPPILDIDGNKMKGSIAALEKVNLGGVDQWLIIRGQDVNKPVLLFLSGGPGASEAARVLRFNQELEKHFVVVIWEQRGCGKSYPSINPKSDLTLNQYESDIIELSEMLGERFDEEKIYLVGHSWGTIIGVHAAKARPDLFHAYVGTAQMVDVLETDQIIYDIVMDYSQTTGDTVFVNTLELQGKPPYFGKSPIQP
jgi:hypothetical protein